VLLRYKKRKNEVLYKKALWGVDVEIDAYEKEEMRCSALIKWIVGIK
jgi:hypothetical protein